MQYTDTITLLSNTDGDKFTMLLLVLLLSIAVYCALNILCDHLRMKKIELAIYLIEKGHNKRAAEMSGATSVEKYKKTRGDESDAKRFNRKKQSYYSSI